MLMVRAGPARRTRGENRGQPQAMNASDEDIQKKLLSTFRIEALEHVQAIASALTALASVDTTDSSPALEITFRELHSLKGAARAVGLGDIESVCHAAEDVLSAIRHRGLAVSAELVSCLYAAIDAVAEQATAIGVDRKAGRMPVKMLIRRLENSIGVPASAAVTVVDTDQNHVETPRKRLTAVRPAPIGTVRIPIARLDSLQFRTDELLSVKLTAARQAEEIRALQCALAVLKRERDRIAPLRRALQQSVEKAAPQLSRAAPEWPWHQLLAFANREAQSMKSFETQLSALAQGVERDRRALGVLVDSVRDDMKQSLMQAISTSWEGLPRLVRTLAHDQGKEVDLLLEGGDIEIDRRVLEELRDPLLHLLRNCIDHGIETSAERSRDGKPPRGKITVAATPRADGRIEILVADDGAGIDNGKVLEAARRLGIEAPKSDEPDSSEDTLSLIFRSGLSTSALITDVSGRGLGLAIVQDKVERLGGLIRVDSLPGYGTAFRIVVPLSLATFRAILVRVGTYRFALPTTQAERCLRIRRDSITTVENRTCILWMGQALALTRLGDAIGLAHQIVGATDIDLPQAVVILTAGASKPIAFAVDEILGDQEILLKPLGKLLVHVRNVAGATVLGDGSIVPVLHVPDLLLSAVHFSSGGGSASASDQPRESERRAILVAEDSITSRALLQTILESAGYKVATAVDGLEALTRLKTEPFDLLVSDVEMPRMNGFDLTARIRADAALEHLPVVLVTALESREHRELGAEAGANAYIVKSSFDDSNLLEVVGRLI